MDASPLTDAERAFLLGLLRRGVRFAVVDMSAALLQGARGATEDVDLWFETLSDPRIADAAHDAGAIYVPGSFGMRPPSISGGALGDRIDVVTHMHGLGPFTTESAALVTIAIDDELSIPVLPLERILVSKRAAGRPKDRAQIPAIEAALAVRAAGTEGR